MPARPFLLQAIGIALFCGMDAVMKALIANNPVLMVTWWRYVFAILFTGLIWWQAGRPTIRRAILPVHTLRGAIISVSAFTFFWSLTRLTLAEAVTFSFIAPLLVPPLASLFLGERMEAKSVAAGALGFAGVLVALGFDRAALTPARLEGVGAVLVGALAYAASLILMRARAGQDGPAILSLLGTLIPALILLPFLLLFLTPAEIVPARVELGLFAAAGLLGALALQFIARAYALAEAQLLAPIEYTALAWAALLGWLFFAEPVAIRTWAGAALIIVACLWQARRPRSVAPA
jgi:S-adenosylmethionine uptake transporter